LFFYILVDDGTIVKTIESWVGMVSLRKEVRPLTLIQTRESKNPPQGYRRRWVFIPIRLRREIASKPIVEPSVPALGFFKSMITQLEKEVNQASLVKNI
jgi:hypothetical protein